MLLSILFYVINHLLIKYKCVHICDYRCIIELPCKLISDLHMKQLVVM